MRGLFDDLISSGLYIFVYCITALLADFRNHVQRFWRIKPKNLGVVCVAIMMIVTVLPISILYGTRDNLTGFDTHNLVNNYNQIGRGVYVSLEGSFNWLYEIMLKVTWHISSGGRFAGLFIIAFVALLSIYISYEMILDKDNSKGFALLMFLLYLGPIMVDQSRQFIGIGIGLIAVAYLIRKKRIAFIILIIIASLFHESALFLLALLIINPGKMNYIQFHRMASLFTPLSILFMPVILNAIPMVLPGKFKYIGEQMHEVNYGMMWIVDIAPVAVVLIVLAMVGKASFEYNDVEKGRIIYMEVLLWSVIIFRFAGYYTYYIMRLFYYGAAICPCTLCWTLAHVKKAENKKLFTLLSTFVFVVQFFLNYVFLHMHKAIPFVFFNG